MCVLHKVKSLKGFQHGWWCLKKYIDSLISERFPLGLSFIVEANQSTLLRLQVQSYD